MHKNNHLVSFEGYTNINEVLSWIGLNLFTTHDPDELQIGEYYYEDLHESKMFGNSTFDSTITVIQNDFVSSINRIDKREVYAKNAGMIYKVLDSLNIAKLPNSTTVILNGTEYKLEVSNYKR